MTENRLTENHNPGETNENQLDKYTFPVQVLIWASVFTACFFVAQLISGVIILSYYKSVALGSIALQTDNLNVLRYTQIFSSIGGFLLPALIFSKLKDNKLLNYSNAHTGFHPIVILLIPTMIYFFYPIIDLSFFVNKMMFWNDFMKSSQGEYKALVDGLLKDSSVYVFILNFITIAAIPAICEEWIFRGTLQKLFSERFNIHLAVFLAAVFFSLIHFEFSGFLPRIILGMFLGYLFYYSGSLWVSILAHLVNNGTQVVLMYLNNKGIYTIDLDNPVMPKTWEVLVYTVVFILLCAIFFHFNQKRKKSTFVTVD